MTIGKWNSLGCGSYRRVRTGVFEVNYRPNGIAGKQVRRLIAATEDEIKELITSASRNKARTGAGLQPQVSWMQAKLLFRERMAAKGNVSRYVDDAMKTVEALEQDTKTKSPADVSPARFETWLNGLARAAQAAKRPGWARTANKKRVMLGTFFRFLFRRRLIPANPVDVTEPFRETKRPPRIITQAEFAAVWHACEQPARDLLDFLLLTGCRIGEAARMKHDDVDERGVWTCSKRKGRDYIRQQLPPVLIEAIKRQPLEKDGLVWHKRTPPRPEVTKGFEPGGPIDEFWFKKVMLERCKKAKVKPFTAHALRHAAATWAASVGTSPWEIKAHLGHTQLSTTERYSHLGSESKMGVSVLSKMRQEALQGVVK